MDALIHWISLYGYPGLTALLMLGIVGLPIPDETLLVFAGFLISQGKMNAAPTFLAGFAGAASGISLSYLLGRLLGRTVVDRYGRYLHLTHDRLGRIERWFERAGDWLLPFGYFIPGVRHFTALTAGIVRLPYGRFSLFAYTGAAIWVAAFLTLGFFVGDHWRDATLLIHRYTWWFVIAMALVGSAAWFIRRHLQSRP